MNTAIHDLLVAAQASAEGKWKYMRNWHISIKWSTCWVLQKGKQRSIDSSRALANRLTSACSYRACNLMMIMRGPSRPHLQQSKHSTSDPYRCRKLKATKKSLDFLSLEWDRTKWTTINNSLSRIIWCTGSLSFSRCWTLLGTWDPRRAFASWIK